MLGPEEAVGRRWSWLNLTDGGRVRFVAVDAVIAHALAATPIPISDHASVRAIPVVAELRSVALRAKLHRVTELNELSPREVQSRRLPFRVTLSAAQIAVNELESRVKLGQFVRRTGYGGWFSQGVTIGTGDAQGFSTIVRLVRRQTGELRWGMNPHCSLSTNRRRSKLRRLVTVAGNRGCKAAQDE